jgi:cell division protein FtsB
MSEDDHQIQRRRDPNAPSGWARWNRRLLIIIFTCLAIISWRLFIPELKKHQEIDTQLKGMQAEFDREDGLNKQLTNEVSWLTDPNDPTYLETIARDKLQAAKPGETVIRLEIEDPRKALRDGQTPVIPPRGE